MSSSPAPPSLEVHTLSDVFSSSSSSPSRPSSPSSPSARTHTHPDIQRLQSIHHTAGYRDGISFSKTSFLQRGFDEGYALGAELGLRVGYILGVLEGLCSSTSASASASVAASASASDEGKGNVARLKKARHELAIEMVFGKEWWGEDGVWTFDVESGGEGGEVTFREVAEKHPLLKAWMERVRMEMREFGVQEGRFEGEEWERGRVGDGGSGGDLK